MINKKLHDLPPELLIKILQYHKDLLISNIIKTEAIGLENKYKLLKVHITNLENRLFLIENNIHSSMLFNEIFCFYVFIGVLYLKRKTLYNLIRIIKKFIIPNNITLGNYINLIIGIVPLYILN